MELPGTVLFLCPHNAAKSLLAAAYFDQHAVARGLPFRADSAGTEPDEQPASTVVAVLRDEGEQTVVTLYQAHGLAALSAAGTEAGDHAESETGDHEHEDGADRQAAAAPAA